MIKLNDLYVIVCSQNVSSMFAAQELRRYIDKIMGIRLPVFTRERRDNALHVLLDSSFGDDGFFIKTDKKSVIIRGGERGVLYGVYDFLETLGCRFFAQGVEKIPTDAQLCVPDINKKISPVFEYRELYWNAVIDEDIAAKFKLNGNFMRPLSEKRGGGFGYADGLFVHTLPRLCNEASAKIGWQPCLTDEKIYKTVLKNVKRSLSIDPEAKIVSVSQFDGDENDDGCHCEKCLVLNNEQDTPMGSLLPFVNRIADDIKDEYPGVKVDTLAYRFTRKPPKNIRAQSNVIVRLCTIECCFSHPIDECTKEMQGKNKLSCADNLRRWAELCDNVYVWDYTTDFAHYMTPFPNFGVLRKNVLLFAQNHVKGVFEQGCAEYVSGEFGELRAYLLAKLLWNPYMSEDEYNAHMDEFLQGYYGDGWRYIRGFIDYCAEGVKNRHFGIYSDPKKILHECEGDSLFFAAEQGAKTEAEKERVRRSRIQLKYYKAHTAPPEQRESLCEDLYKDMLRYGIKGVHEGCPLVEKPNFKNIPQKWHLEENV